MKNKLVVIAGPTAVGKTKYAIDYASREVGNRYFSEVDSK